MSSQPRPILKRLSSCTKQANNALPFAKCGRILSPHVHFPPTPSMVASTHPAHSPHTYDRKPIVVSPHCCDLPQRGDRRLHSPPADFEAERCGRSGTVDEIKGSYFHPRAYEACEPEPLELDESPISPPLLLADEYESDSDEETVTTPPDPKLSPIVESTTSRPKPPYRRTSFPIPTLEKGQDMVDDQAHRPLLRCSRRIVVLQLEPQDQWSGRDEGCLGGF